MVFKKKKSQKAQIFKKQLNNDKKIQCGYKKLLILSRFTKQ